MDYSCCWVESKLQGMGKGGAERRGQAYKLCGLNKGESVGDGVKWSDSKYSWKVQLTEDFIIIHNIYPAASASR